MILQCHVLCSKVEDIEQQEYLADLGVPAPPVDDYWLERYLDVSMAISLFPYHASEDNKMGEGNLCLDVDNSGMAIVTNIPFDDFVPYIVMKNKDVMLLYDGENKAFQLIG